MRNAQTTPRHALLWLYCRFLVWDTYRLK